MIADPRNAVVTIGLVGSFATLVTLHVALVFGLIRRRHFLGAATGFALPPLAPFWGWRNGLRVRSIAWVIALVAYGAFFLLAR